MLLIQPSSWPSWLLVLVLVKACVWGGLDPCSVPFGLTNVFNNNANWQSVRVHRHGLNYSAVCIVVCIVLVVVVGETFSAGGVQQVRPWILSWVQPLSTRVEGTAGVMCSDVRPGHRVTHKTCCFTNALVFPLSPPLPRWPWSMIVWTKGLLSKQVLCRSNKTAAPPEKSHGQGPKRQKWKRQK